MSLLAPPDDRRFSPRTVQVVALTGVACSSFTITVLSAALATIAAAPRSRGRLRVSAQCLLCVRADV